jgi:hypothetical protein
VWPDNETDIDLLGFDFLVDGLVVALSEPRLLPLTVGVLGDWGSGKSSLMGLACAELSAVTDAEDRYVCVRFSPWQYEDYEDVKVALMAAVLTRLAREAAGDASKEEEVGQLRAFVRRFGRRSRRVVRGGVGLLPRQRRGRPGRPFRGRRDPVQPARTGPDPRRPGIRRVR